MRLGISKSKNTVNYYIIKDYTKNGKRSTKHVLRIGNLEEVKLLAGDKDLNEWLKDYVKKYNDEHLDKKEEIIIKKQADQPLGKYGRMAMKHLHETDPQRFSLLKMQGELMSLMYRVDEEATEQVEAITQKLLAQDPMPQTGDILERTRHLNKHRDIAEEIAISELVLIPR